MSSVELTQACLDAIERRNPQLNAFITVTGESALIRAAELDRARAHGQPCGPLCGIPIALKDVFATRGVRTTAGAKLFEHRVPDFSATAAHRLEAAGAILIGKTNLHELAYGVTSENPHYGAVRNPVNPGHMAGGSSGGSAVAVASGMALAALGTDTGGSIRIPAAYCGVVGLKPTSGRISRSGVFPLDFSLDHVGPLAQSVADAALLLNALAGHDSAGHDPNDDTSSRRPVADCTPPPEPSLRGVRIGWPENFFFERVDAQILAAVTRAAKLAEAAGAFLVPVRLPDIAAINQIGRIILLCEAAALFENRLRRQPESFGEDVRLLLYQGALLPATAYIDAQRLRRVMQREFARVWNRIDVLFTPSTPLAAPPLGSREVNLVGELEDVRIASTRFTRAFNVLGIPAISIPCGFTDARLPIGLQIVAAAWGEKRLLEVAAGVENCLRTNVSAAP